MPLEFTDKEGSSPQFETLLEAFDGEKRVVVVSSKEAIEDHGLPSIQSKASEKYDAKLFDGKGLVRVMNSDFR